MTPDHDLAQRLADVRARLARAARRSGRLPDAVRLIAVSKTYPADHVRLAAAAGQLDFGENRVQEGLQKAETLRDLPLRWHLIGHLQSNKARKAATSFHAVHSVDRLELLETLDRAAAEAGCTPDLLVQVDLAGEATKHGLALEGLRQVLAAGARCRAARLVGLMLLPPFLEDPEQVRPYFRHLRELRDQAVAEGVVASEMVRELSMGMSHDFEVAVEEGATMVRVGTAIFGQRPRPVAG